MSLDLTVMWEGHRVRMVGTAEQPEWVAKDVCFVLDIHNSRRALAEMIPAPEKGVRIAYTPGGPQEYATVTEAGLFRLISRSRKPSAARFQSWLFGEVLPSIRQHGQYPPPAPVRPASREFQIATALLLAQEIITEQGARLAVAEPKAAVLDAIAESDGDLSLQDVGRHLGLGPNRAIWRMEEDGLLFRGSHGTLTPHAAWLDAGYFRYVTTAPDAAGRTFGQTKVTKRGLVWLATRYRQNGGGQLERGQ